MSEIKEQVLQVKDLTISFRTANGKVQAVRDISFSVAKGETLAIVGESGSGKSVTSKAILGISAVNAMHESGEILYRGKDLLQIDEDEFHTLRGSRISMVFQDPLSALNPIMRTGKQITEAILINNETDRKAAKKNLDQLYKDLDLELSEAAKDDPQVKQEAEESLIKFKRIQKRQIELEIAYSKARDHIYEANRVAKNLVSDISKRVQKNARSGLTRVNKQLELGLNPDLLQSSDLEEFKQTQARFEADQHYSNLAEGLSSLSQMLEEKLKLEEPDFFAAAYGDLYAPNSNMDSKAAREKLDQEFVAPFEKMIERAIRSCDQKAKQERQKARAVLSEFKPILAKMPLKEAEAKRAIKAMSQAVEAAINPLDVHKDSSLYTFRNTANNNLKRYTEGIVKNRAEEKRYAKSKRKHDRASKGSKNPGWKVVPKDLIDLEWAQGKLVEAVERIIQRFDQLDQAVSEIDYTQKASSLIEHSSQLASRAAREITPIAAKEHAINLMREVGIPEPELRFKQFPFELSGGMRQRIVIAIALSANPDVLICDEPTTALDVTIQAQILELINQLKVERQLSIIFITHDLGVVANMADRIAVMYAGKIVEIGNVDEVFYEPAHPYTWALLSSMPDLETKEKLMAISGTPPNMLMPPVGDAFAARNPYAMKIDFERQPPMFKITDTHYAATWLLAKGAPKVELPPIVTERIERMKKREAKNESR